MTAVTRPQGPKVVEGAVQAYKPTPLHQKVINILTSPTALATIAPLVPKGVDQEAVMIEVYRAATENPAILNCTEQSIVMSVADCLSLDLIIGKTIHLVPLNVKVKGANNAETKELRCHAWTDYKGDIELVIRSGAARSVQAAAVYENDKFEVYLGTDPRVVHMPALKGPRGKMVGAYAVAFVTSMLKKVCFMRMDEIEAIRKNSRQWNPKVVSECPEWYALKTPIHRITKDLPKNPRLAAIIARLDREHELDTIADAEFTIEHEQRPAPAAAAEHVAASEQPSAPAAYDSHGEADRAVTRQDDEVPEVPSCPRCNGDMYDNRQANDKRASKGERLWPDFKCKDRQNCDGKYWRGEWPPHSEDQGDLRF